MMVHHAGKNWSDFSNLLNILLKLILVLDSNLLFSPPNFEIKVARQT